MTSITKQQLDDYREQGFVVIEGFATQAECEGLRARAEELVQGFDPNEVVSIFSTHEQNRLTDDYFLTSGDKIRFFFEENAFLPDGTLKYGKQKSSTKSVTRCTISIRSSNSSRAVRRSKSSRTQSA